MHTPSCASWLRAPGRHTLAEDTRALLGMECTRLEGACFLMRASRLSEAYSLEDASSALLGYTHLCYSFSGLFCFLVPTEPLQNF